MESRHPESADAPALVRRRRKVARQSRDKTPEARMLSAQMYSDDEDETSSAQDHMMKQQQQQHHRRPTHSRSSKTPPLSPIRHTSTPTESDKNTSKLQPAVSPRPNRKNEPHKTLSPVAKESTRSSSHSVKPQTLSPPPPPVRKISPVLPEPNNTADNDESVQTVRMQIRPPGSHHTISAHESKILRRRNRQFAGQAARSQSQPRENTNEQQQSNPEVKDLMRSARRSLSSTRHKDETDESEQNSPRLAKYSPVTDIQKELLKYKNKQDVDEDKLSKLERNLRRFDEERHKFEVEKKKFERERSDLHKLRYRQLIEAQERKKMIENYRKNSEDSAELLKLLPKASQSFREPKRAEIEEKPVIRRTESNRRSKTFKDYESSTASESDSEAVHAEMIEYRKNHHPTRRINRGPPPPPPVEETKKSQSPDPIPEKKIISRNSSLSPQLIRRKSSKVSEEKEIKTENLSKEPIYNETSEQKTYDAEEVKPEIKEQVKKPGIFKRLFGKTEKTKHDQLNGSAKKEAVSTESKVKKYSWASFKMFVRIARTEWIQFKQDNQRQLVLIRLQRNRCIGNFILLAILLGFGGLAFRFTEGNTDGVYKCEVKKVKRDFIDQLWLQSHSMREEDWKSHARNRLRTFEEELYNVYDNGPALSYTGLKAWGFINSIIYCWTIVTQIGYGHIAPKTTLGQGITIVYAIFGIPIFLILLADFGKLFTRGIKFIWAYVRRVYYTGTCRKVRKSQQMQDMMKGVNIAYDVAIRRPSQYIRDVDIEQLDRNEAEASDVLPETPTSPYPETLEIDDDFNLPVSVATVVLVLYIIVGAFVYPLWEVKWSYFEAFYFVFISMSTIGFGDYVPDHPIFMMLSTVYLVFGLALTSMFINVVQIKLSDSFRQASAKIGATIGFSMTEEELSKHSQLGTPVPPIALNNIPEENDLEDKEVRNITGTESSYTPDPNAPPPLLPRSPRIQPEEPKKKKKSLFF